MKPICRPDKTHYWKWWRKPINSSCYWVDVKFANLDAGVCARRIVQHCEEEEIQPLKESLSERTLARKYDVPEELEPEASVHEDQLQLRFLPTPVRTLQGIRNGQIRLSRASADFARRTRGLPLSIAVDGEEEPEIE